MENKAGAKNQRGEVRHEASSVPELVAGFGGGITRTAAGRLELPLNWERSLVLHEGC